MKKDELSDEQIGTYIDRKAASAEAWYSSKLATEREMVMAYIDRKRPLEREGSSSFVTAHVYNGVEYMRAQLAETFSKGSGIVRFDPRGPKDVSQAFVATEYTSHVFYRQNKGESIIRDILFDGLTARVGVAKVWWDREEIEEEREFGSHIEAVTQADIDVWEADDNITHLEASENGDGTFSGRLLVKVDRGQVRVEVIRPEEFSVEPQAKGLDENTFCVHHTTKTIDWIKTNFPKVRDRVEDLLAAEEGVNDMSPEVLQRFGDIDNDFDARDDAIQDELREVKVYEAYAKMKRKGDLTARLYKIMRCGKVNLSIEPVASLPFVTFVALPRPHRFYGENFARTLIPQQNVATAGARAIIDNAMQATNTKWGVVKGGLVNPEELKARRIGGIVNVKSRDSVFPMPVGMLNPTLGPMLQQIEQMNEAISGISSTSMGLNKDVISKQNSAGLMEQQTGMSQTRQKEIARSFCDGFLIPLFEKIYDLVVQFESRKDIEIVTDMGWVPVDIAEMGESKRWCSASAHLGYGERDAEANKIAQFAQNPLVQKFSGDEGGYAIASDILTLWGHRNNVTRYLPVTPDKIQPPQPNPVEVAKAQNLQADAQSKTLLAQAQLKKVTDHGQLAREKAELAAHSEADQVQLRQRDLARKETETANRVHTSQTETQLLVEEAKNSPDNTKGIISPNG